MNGVAVRELAADLETPVSAFLKLRRPGSPAFLLESVAGGEHLARYSFLGVDASPGLEVRDGRVVTGRTDLSPVDALRDLLRPASTPELPRTPPFRGGHVGFLAYDFVRQLERLPRTVPDPLGLPEAQFLRFSTIAAFDHARQTLLLVTENDANSGRRLDDLEARLAQPLMRIPAEPTVSGPLVSNFERSDFEAAVERAKEEIAAGEIFQVVLSQRWTAPFDGDPFAIYRRLRRIDPSPYMVYFENDGLALVAASPEMLVRVHGRSAETHPIAGTRPRADEEAENARREAELLADPKENAEHVMLVDLGRNDLGRVARPGTVEVPSFRQIERYSSVTHLVSRVVAEIRPEVEPVDVLLAAFPAGTVSGAPKVRAMEIIEALEPERRGLYAGAVAYVDAGGNLDSCITIRSLVFTNGNVHLQAGAGIVADSVPAREYEETVAKSGALRAALGEPR